jgi:hypothetical protein
LFFICTCEREREEEDHIITESLKPTTPFLAIYIKTNEQIFSTKKERKTPLYQSIGALRSFFLSAFFFFRSSRTSLPAFKAFSICLAFSGSTSGGMRVFAAVSKIACSFARASSTLAACDLDAVDNELPFLVDALLLGSLDCFHKLRLEPVRGLQVEAEVGLGVDLVDVLAAGAARARKLERDVG